MRITGVLCFWLGSLDSRVAAGGNTGGTRDIRVCRDEAPFYGLLGSHLRPGQGATIRLEAYPELGLDPYNLRIERYAGARSGEFGLPAQHANSDHPYELWRRCVRLLAPGAVRVQDAVLIIKDTDDRFHARVIGREHVGSLPLWLAGPLRDFDECARWVRAPEGALLLDMPTPGIPALQGELGPIAIASADIDAELVALQQLAGPGGTESAGQRHRRSRTLAERLKRLYDYRCQVCDGDIPRIPMGGVRFYVEVHHVGGLSEVEGEPTGESGTDEDRHLSLDRYDKIVVLCPHHHRVIHHSDAGYQFDPVRKEFRATHGGDTLPLVLNHHL